jgi:hypothetical protein
MRLRRLVPSAVIVGACFAALGAPVASAGPPSMFAKLTGQQEAPGPGDANGHGGALIDAKVGSGQICLGVRYRNLDSTTAMHIHSGAMGVAGPIVVNLTPLLTSGKCVSAAPTLVADIKNHPSLYYLNIHTGTFPNGATRGQLESSLAASPFGVVSGPLFQFARMNGAQERPGPGDTNGSGVPFVDLKPSTGQVCTDVRYRNIDAPTAMHIHSGAAGVAGPIVVNLTPVLTGTRCVSADPSLIRDIRDNFAGYYCNIHTGTFPDGAIRGQLEPSS